MGDYSKIFITGATSGIGYALARLFIRQNKEVIAIGRNELALQELRSWGCRSERIDLGTLEGIELLRNLLLQDQPDLVIHAAGFTQYGLLGERSWDELLYEHRLHTESTLAIVHTLHQLAKANPEIAYCSLFLSSAVAYTPTPGMTLYSSSKLWMLTLCRMLNLENPPNLNFLCSTPGPVQTAFHLRASQGHYQERTPGVVSPEKAAEILFQQIQNKIQERPLGPLAWLAKISSRLLSQRLIAKALFYKIKQRM